MAEDIRDTGGALVRFDGIPHWVKAWSGTDGVLMSHKGLHSKECDLTEMYVLLENMESGYRGKTAFVKMHGPILYTNEYDTRPLGILNTSDRTFGDLWTFVSGMIADYAHGSTWFSGAVSLAISSHGSYCTALFEAPGSNAVLLPRVDRDAHEVDLSLRASTYYDYIVDMEHLDSDGLLHGVQNVQMVISLFGGSMYLSNSVIVIAEGDGIEAYALRRKTKRRIQIVPHHAIDEKPIVDPIAIGLSRDNMLEHDLVRENPSKEDHFSGINGAPDTRIGITELLYHCRKRISFPQSPAQGEI